MSHTHVDKPVVEPIAIRLRDIYGQDKIFYDSWSIQYGDGIIQKMNEGLTAPQFVFFFISKNSLNSVMVKIEWQTAFMKATQSECKIIPVRVDGAAMPEVFMQKLHIDMHTQEMEAAILNIVNVVQGNNTFLTDADLKKKFQTIVSKTPISAQIVQDQSTGQIHEILDPVLDQDKLDHALWELKEARDSIDDISGNFRTLLNPIHSKLTRALEQYSNNPARVISIAAKSAGQLQNIWHEQELGDPYRDGHVSGIIRHLDSAIFNLMDFEEICDIGKKQFNPEDLLASPLQEPFFKQLEAMRDVSRESLYREIKDDEDRLRDPFSDQQDKQDAAYFLSARLIRLVQGIKNGTIKIGAGTIEIAGRLNVIQKFFASDWGKRLIEIFYNLF